jgi:limonene-1,2-epoxide hydrolase
MTDQTPSIADVDNARTVESFLHALQDQDFDTAEALVSDQLAWENVGWPTVRGGRRIMKLFRRAEGRMGVAIKIHRIAADGTAVLTERTDAMIFGPVRIEFWVCGTFEVHAGRITLWRDYFDVFDVLKGTARGIAATVIPALRRSF